jgi:hypothetical protein
MLLLLVLGGGVQGGGWGSEMWSCAPAPMPPSRPPFEMLMEEERDYLEPYCFYKFMTVCIDQIILVYLSLLKRWAYLR